MGVLSSLFAVFYVTLSKVERKIVRLKNYVRIKKEVATVFPSTLDK